MIQYETRIRSIVKAVSWRICATITTGLLVFIFTQNISIAVTIGGIEMVLKMLIYFFHERLWNKVNFGKKEIKPFVLWFTGLPYSGKTTIANKIYGSLKRKGLKIERLDNRDVRSLFRGLGYSKQEVNSHIRRVGHLVSILERNGISVIASFVSPCRE